MKVEPNFSLLIPALNECEGLKEFLPLVPKNLFCQIIVADGRSTDGSVEWLQQNKFEYYIQKNRGIKCAYVEVWPYLKGEYVITFSPDGNCLIEDLPKIIEELKRGRDMVIASRYKPPAKSEDDNLLTAFGNYFFTKMISILFGFRFTDSMTIYRGYKKSLFTDLDISKTKIVWLEKILGTSVGIEPLLSIRAAKYKKSISEVASDEPKRKHGYRKMLPFRWGLLILVQIIIEFFQLFFPERKSS